MLIYGYRDNYGGSIRRAGALPSTNSHPPFNQQHPHGPPPPSITAAAGRSDRTRRRDQEERKGKGAVPPIIKFVEHTLPASFCFFHSLPQTSGLFFSANRYQLSGRQASHPSGHPCREANLTQCPRSRDVAYQVARSRQVLADVCFFVA